MTDVLHGTVELSATIEAPVAQAWAAFEDPAARAAWSVPAGEGMEYDVADFREGHGDAYRCGPPETLDFAVEVAYVRIAAPELVVYSETVRTAGQTLATGLVTWEFTPAAEGTQVRVTSQAVSFVGQGMIDGQRNGHEKALGQLAQYLTGP